MSKTIIKSHNQRVALYHFVCPTKYCKKVFTAAAAITATLKQVYVGISEDYEVFFIEIGCDEDHLHFLIHSVAMLSVKQIIQMVKSITACEIFRQHPQAKKLLWGGDFWTNGYYLNTVGV